MRIDLWLLGYTRCEVENGEAARLFEVLRSDKFLPKRAKRCKKTGKISFFLSEREGRRLQTVAAREQLNVAFTKTGGFPPLFRRLLARPSLIVGIVLALLLLGSARLFLWEVKIEGNYDLDSTELEEELALAGLFRGRFLPTLSEDAVALALRSGDARVAYAGVNVVGTVAYVQVREREAGGAPLAKTPANLVARCEGVVTMPLIFEGKCLVAAGDVVRAGQLLASGVIDTQNHGYRVTRAAGQVLARTVQQYTVRVPFSDTKKSYTGQKTEEISLLFFGNGRKLFKFTNKNIDKCDIIEEIKYFTLPDGKRLPFGIAKRTAVEYTEAPVQRDALEARQMAYDELERLLAADSAGRAMLQRTVEVAVDAEGITLFCTVIAEEDIAQLVEIHLQP